MRLTEAKKKYGISSTYFYHLKKKAVNDEELEKLLQEFALRKDNNKTESKNETTDNKKSK